MWIEVVLVGLAILFVGMVIILPGKAGEEYDLDAPGSIEGKTCGGCHYFVGGCYAQVKAATSNTPACPQYSIVVEVMGSCAQVIRVLDGKNTSRNF